MSISAFTFTDRVRPVIELGIGDSRTIVGAVWDVGRWDTTARWSGLEPDWLDITCDTQSASCEYGRQSTIDRFIPGTATITVDNTSGWADPDTSDMPGVLSVRPGRQIRISVVHVVYGRRVLFRGYIDAMTPVYSPTDSDTVELSCVDALGEVNRAKMKPAGAPVGAGDSASDRINRILDAAGWLPRDISPSSETLIATDLGGQVGDLLGQTADSAGGSVFGNYDGEVAFRGRDWQTYLPDEPVDGTIGNVGTGATIPGTPAVPVHLDPSIGTVTVPYTAGTGVTVAADPAAAATYWRTVGANAEVGRNPAGTLYPGVIRSLQVTQTPAAAGTDVLLEPFNNLTNWPGSTGTITVGRTGNGLTITTSSAGPARSYTIPTAAKSNYVTIGYAFQVNTLANACPMFSLQSDAGTVDQITVQVQNPGNINVYKGGVASIILGSTANGLITTGVWYYIEVQVFVDDTAGTGVVRINGTPRLTFGPFDTRASGANPIDTVALRGAQFSAITTLWDDLYITTGAGAPFKGDITIPPAVAATADPGFTFAAADYPGTGTSYTDPRGETWTLSTAGAIVPTVPATPDINDPADVCPTGWTRPFDRADITTRAIIGRDAATAVVVDDTDGIARYGIEPFERTDLLTLRDTSLTMLANRVLRVRGEDTAPRVRSVSLDASTSTGALDLMSTVDVYQPSRYRCRLQYPPPRGLVFDDDYFATGVAHDLTPSAWTLELNLDVAAPFAAAGGRWDGAYWDLALWTDAVALVAEAPTPIGAT